MSRCSSLSDCISFSFTMRIPTRSVFFVYYDSTEMPEVPSLYNRRREIHRRRSVFELKYTDSEKVSLKKESEEALRQIGHMAYETEMREHGISKIEKAGLAFHGKEVEITV